MRAPVSADRAQAAIDAALGTLFTACSLLVERKGVRTSYLTGTRCPDPNAGPDAPCDATTLFDLASLTKLATTALTLLLVRERVIGLDTPFRELVPDFHGDRKDRVTLVHVLTHTAGLEWWLPLYEEVRSAEEAAWRAAQNPLAHDIGSFVYSDLGYIMLTVALERVGGQPFRELIRERVLRAVDAGTADFLPEDATRCVATEADAPLRHRRLRGEVHDDNAAAMGGVAGHAGLFGTAADVAALARIFRDGAVIGNELAHLARREHARGNNVRRGLGLALRAPDGPMVGRHMSQDAYGHTGFTGTSLWVDPATDTTIVLLTNRVYFGRANDDALYRFRIAVHEALTQPVSA